MAPPPITRTHFFEYLSILEGQMLVCPTLVALHAAVGGDLGITTSAAAQLIRRTARERYVKVLPLARGFQLKLMYHGVRQLEKDRRYLEQPIPEFKPKEKPESKKPAAKPKAKAPARKAKPKAKPKPAAKKPARKPRASRPPAAKAAPKRRRQTAAAKPPPVEPPPPPEDPPEDSPPPPIDPPPPAADTDLDAALDLEPPPPPLEDPVEDPPADEDPPIDPDLLGDDEPEPVVDLPPPSRKQIDYRPAAPIPRSQQVAPTDNRPTGGSPMTQRLGRLMEFLQQPKSNQDGNVPGAVMRADGQVEVVVAEALGISVEHATTLFHHGIGMGKLTRCLQHRTHYYVALRHTPAADMAAAWLDATVLQRPPGAASDQQEAA